MRYAQIRAFHNVALHGGFSRAADAVFQSQPALSEQVRKLEQEYDTLLFHRDRKRIRLTPAGRNLFMLTRRFFEAEEQIEDFLSETRAAVDGTLRIVVDSAHHITDTLSRFRRHHPGVFISLRTGNTDDVLDALRAYNAEIGVVGSLDPGSEFETLNLGEAPIVAFAENSYLPPGTTRLCLKDLTEEHLVFRETGSRTRRKLEREAARQGIELRPALEVEGREALREIVASGAGIGFVSEAEFGNDARLRKIPLADKGLTMGETLVCLTTRRDVRLIRAFMSLAGMSLTGMSLTGMSLAGAPDTGGGGTDQERR